MSFQTSALILSWVAILLLSLVVSGLVRQVQQLSARVVRGPEPVGLPPGVPAPEFSTLAPPFPATLVLLFLQPGCGTCTDLLHEAARPGAGDPVQFQVLYRDDIPPEATGLPLPPLGGRAALFERYDAIATPFAVVIDASGKVLRSEPVGSRAALHRLLDRAGVAAIDRLARPAGDLLARPAGDRGGAR